MATNNIPVTVYKKNLIPVTRQTEVLNLLNVKKVTRRVNGDNPCTISASGTTATATFTYPHNRVTGDAITIVKSATANFNKTDVSCTVTGANTLTYTITSTTASNVPAFMAETTLSYDADGAKKIYYTINESLTAVAALMPSKSFASVSLADGNLTPNVLISKNILDTKSTTENAISVSGITRSSTTATATTSANHGYSTGDYVTVAGADQSDYNITAQITVTGATTFTYTVANSPATPATGTITSARGYCTIVYKNTHPMPEYIAVTNNLANIQSQIS